MNLYEGVVDNGYTLCTENYQNGVGLVNKLKLKLMHLVGTLQPNCTGNPHEVETAKLKCREVKKKGLQS